jgi:hypothetical protein
MIKKIFVRKHQIFQQLQVDQSSCNGENMFSWENSWWGSGEQKTTAILMPGNFHWILSPMSPVWYLSLHKSTATSYLLSLGITTTKQMCASGQCLLQHMLHIRWQWGATTPLTSSIIPSELLTLPLNTLQTSKWTIFHNQTEQIGRPETWRLLYYILNSAGQLWASRLNHTILVMPLSAPMPTISLFTIHGLPKWCNITIRGGHLASFWHTHACTRTHSDGQSPLHLTRKTTITTRNARNYVRHWYQHCGCKTLWGHPKLSAGVRTHCANVSLCQKEQWYWWNLSMKKMQFVSIAQFIYLWSISLCYQTTQCWSIRWFHE